EAGADFVLYKPADAIRGAGPASISYLLRKPAEKMTIEVLDSKGTVVQTIQGAVPGAGRGGGRGRGRGEGGVPEAAQAAEAGRAGAPAGAPAAAAGAPAEAQAEEGGGGGGRGRGGPPTASMAAGLNRANWNLDYPGAVTFPGMVLWGATTGGPTALPGTYEVRMTVDGKTQSKPL